MKTSVLEVVEAVAVCAWLLLPVVAAFLMDYPRRKSPRKSCGNVNH